MTDVNAIGYSAAPARPRNGVLLAVLWCLLGIQIVLFALSFYRPARTAPAIPVVSSATAFNRVGIHEGVWVVGRADLARATTSGPARSSVSGNPLPGIFYVLAPSVGLRWGVGVHALWTIVPTLGFTTWQTWRRYRSVRRS